MDRTRENAHITYNVGLRAKDVAIVAAWLDSMGISFRGRSSVISEGIYALALIIRKNFASDSPNGTLEIPLTLEQAFNTLERFGLLPNSKQKLKLERLLEEGDITASLITEQISHSYLPDEPAPIIEEEERPVVMPARMSDEERLELAQLQREAEQRSRDRIAEHERIRKEKDAAFAKAQKKEKKAKQKDKPAKNNDDEDEEILPDKMDEETFLHREKRIQKENDLGSFLQNIKKGD